MYITALHLVFIEFGLPTVLLGVAWPEMHKSFGLPVSAAGFVNAVIVGAMACANTFSVRMIERLGTFRAMAVSSSVFTVALCLAAFTGGIVSFLAVMVVYGLACGCLNTVVTNHAAIHHSSRRMNLLSSTWCVGVMSGGWLMSVGICGPFSWRLGYFFVGICSFAITVFAVLSRRSWPADISRTSSDTTSGRLSLLVNGVPRLVFFSFMFCALEVCCGVWSCSFMTEHFGSAPVVAARAPLLYFLGELSGRIAVGVFGKRLADERQIAAGTAIASVGSIVVLASANAAFAIAGLFILGFGCGPVYPAMMHRIPAAFPSIDSAKVIALVMSVNFISCIIMPTLFGLLIPFATIAVYPWLLVATSLLAILLHFNRRS